MKLRFIYSACVVIESEEVTLCCDPWFTNGIFDGSWYQYPPLDKDPIDLIGEVDVIYISHLHPDHFDPGFLKMYLNRYPKTQIIIGDTSPPYFSIMMQAQGIQSSILSQTEFGETKLHIFTSNAHEGQHEDIDTALVISRGDLSIVNLNDNTFDQMLIDKILSVCPSGQPTLALLPYSSAGPYPQTYAFETKEQLKGEALRMRQYELDQYNHFVQALKPIRAMPFAGQYVLVGPLARLNDFRSVPDATEVLLHNDNSIVLADGGDAFIDLKNLSTSETRLEPYKPEDMDKFLKNINFDGYAYENELRFTEGRHIPLLSLTKSAYNKAIKDTLVKESYWLCLKPLGWDKYIAFDISNENEIKVLEAVSDLKPRLEIFIDQRYLFGLLTRLYHWDNAGIGSHYQAKRVPNDAYKREVYGFLHHFHV